MAVIFIYDSSLPALIAPTSLADSAIVENHQDAVIGMSNEPAEIETTVSNNSLEVVHDPIDSFMSLGVTTSQQSYPGSK